MSIETLKPKTPAQRQAERKARELAAGRVQWKRWVHPDDVPAMREHAAKLARKRSKVGRPRKAAIIADYPKSDNSTKEQTP